MGMALGYLPELASVQTALPDICPAYQPVDSKPSLNNVAVLLAAVTTRVNVAAWGVVSLAPFTVIV